MPDSFMQFVRQVQNFQRGYPSIPTWQRIAISNQESKPEFPHFAHSSFIPFHNLPQDRGCNRKYPTPHNHQTLPPHGWQCKPLQAVPNDKDTYCLADLSLPAPRIRQSQQFGKLKARAVFMLVSSMPCCASFAYVGLLLGKKDCLISSRSSCMRWTLGFCWDE